MSPRLLLLVACLVPLMIMGGGVGMAESDEHDDMADQELARAALARHEVRPLASILQQVRDRWPGEVIGVDLERLDGHWVYELELILPDGRVEEFYVDGLTAERLDRAVKP